MNNRYLKARTLARAKHTGQMYGDVPYYIHLDAVSRLASPFGTDAMIVAQLHDVLEDTETTIDELAADFGFLVADAVGYMTDDKLESRQDRKHQINQRLAILDTVEEAARIALIVKACDRLANVRASLYSNHHYYQLYQEEHQAFKQSVYRKGLCEAIWWELDNLLRYSEAS
ncbi:bifunctional (p)ppGpp synthetase/guanosine-3',5'-bis(diphosphate) 3'-pyrophosphohydrolase [Photobacterium sp. BZF1]|uniref:HD domain-containing protein n=1 Tax=Photobacterium TaxID=657 RepID=UPI001653A419|nr:MULTISPECIES: HD domain-containing protein [Photobacterium]MBC7005290.1 bifunctional (p)ppGpp synthetase/guanosine-3',5'-bis(diphosphate) 3'-pyrophosphohydrolase [Photobacterium sp. BZF1]MBY5946423.1 HD domain-containing protein [Photobacterium rosenbergii]